MAFLWSYFSIFLHDFSPQRKCQTNWRHSHFCQCHLLITGNSVTRCLVRHLFKNALSRRFWLFYLLQIVKKCYFVHIALKMAPRTAKAKVYTFPVIMFLLICKYKLVCIVINRHFYAFTCLFCRML